MIRSHRKLHIIRGSADRDPLFTPQWVTGLDQILPASYATTPPQPPTPEPFTLAPPAPPPSETEQKWNAVIDAAPDVLAALGQDVNYDLLTEVVRDVVQGGLSIDDIVAIYRSRSGDADDGR